MPEQRHIDKAHALHVALSFLDDNQWAAGEAVNLIADALAEAEGRWIPLAEGLPKAASRVLAYIPHIGIYACVYNGSMFVTVPAYWEQRHATHWRELPELPEEGE